MPAQPFIRVQVVKNRMGSILVQLIQGYPVQARFSTYPQPPFLFIGIEGKYIIVCNRFGISGLMTKRDEFSTLQVDPLEASFESGYP